MAIKENTGWDALGINIHEEHEEEEEKRNVDRRQKSVLLFVSFVLFVDISLPCTRHRLAGSFCVES
jgi:hypothetical protein